MVALTVNAQTTYRIPKNEIKKGKVNHFERVISGPNSVQQVAGSIVCGTQYVAGTTMDLNLTFTSLNASGDLEYVDYLEITFPAGITPTGAGATSDPFPNTEDAGGGQEALNAVAGQVISWGDAAGTDEYGGIWSTTGIGFVVEVTVAGGTTGNLTANYLLDGDGYTGAPGVVTPGVGTTANGSFTIFEAGASIDDAALTILEVGGTSYCNNTTLPIAMRIKNLGTTTLSNIPVSYQIDALPVVSETVTATVLPGDSVDYIFTALGDFSVEADYAIVGNVTVVGDAVSSNNTANAAWTNTIPAVLTSTTPSTPYVNGFETADLSGVLIANGTSASPSSGWGLSATAQSGTQALFCTAAAANGGVADSWVFLKCMDVVMNDIYRITYYTRTNTNFNGGLDIAAGLNPAIADMLVPVKPFSANTANSQWRKDSVDMAAPASGIIYLGFHASGVNTGNGSNIRLDNVNIFKVDVVGTKEISSSNLVSIFPNPNAGVFTVKATENNSSVAVYSIIGENVYSSKLVKGNNSIDLTNLAAGSYIVKVNNGGTLVTKRVVINK